MKVKGGLDLRSYEVTGNKSFITQNAFGAHRNGSRGIHKKQGTFTGPAQEVVESSSSTRISNIGFLQQYEYLRQEVYHAEKQFIQRFYRALDSMKKSIDVPWVEACKERHKELLSLFCAVVQQDSTVELVILTKSGKVYNLDDVAYAPHNYTIKGITEEDEIIDVFISHKYPKIFAPLFKVMLKVALACQQCRDSEPDLFDEVKQLAFSLYERGGLYNETNPDKKEWRKQEDATLEILTHPPTRQEDEEVAEAWEDTKKDIKEGCMFLRKRQDNKVKPYVIEMCRAINSTYRYCHSKYDERDYYYSMSSNAAIIKELKELGITQSLLKSALEKDPLRDSDFDQFIGYESHYNQGDYDGPWVITIHIPNPGKFKTRPIHLTLSPIQDRCAYIHNRLHSILKKLPCDCTDGVEKKGLTFLLHVTDKEWRSNNGWPTVLAYDWSNATDKLWNWYQEDCLALVFPSEVVEFWHRISTCPKLFCHKDGQKEMYTQENGQPQGLLGSFNAFAFAHECAELTAQNMADMKDIRQSDACRIEGDDSILTSTRCDKDNAFGDAYKRVCAWINIPINDSKSTEILFDNENALVEFTKVHALNGEYFSPVPERLANRIGKHNCDYYAFAAAFWGQRRGHDNRRLLLRHIDHYYKDEVDNMIVKLLLFSGVLPAYRKLGFSSPVYSGTDLCLQIALCYWLNKVKATLAMGLFSDKIKENLDLMDKEPEDALLTLIPEDLTFLWDQIEDPNHKLLLAVQDNLSSEDTIRTLLHCSPDQAAILSVGLKLSAEESLAIYRMLDIINTVTEQPDTIHLFRDQILSLEDSFKPLERLNYRSVYKRDASDSMIFRRTVKSWKDWFGQNDELVQSLSEIDVDLLSIV